MAEKAPNGFNWSALFGIFQRVKYWSAVVMLTVAAIAMAGVLVVVASRTGSSSVQIAVVVGVGITALAFFAAVVLVIKILGPYALLSSSQVLSYSRMEAGAKGLPHPPDTRPIPDSQHPPKQLPPPIEEDPA